MLAPHGIRSLWPVLLFVPWLALGLAYLFQSARRRPGGGTQPTH